MSAQVPAPQPEPSDLPPPGGTLAAVFREGRRLRLRQGTVLFDEGDVSNRVILLLAGRAKVSTYSAEGQETVLSFRRPGDILGELSAVDGAAHMATVTVVEDGEGLVLPAERFIEALRANPDLALEMLGLVVRRLRDADRKLGEFLALDVVGRVARRLVELAEEYGVPGEGGILIDLTISQRELAGWVGASREAVNKALAQLEAQNLVRSERRTLVVCDLAGLRRRAA